MATDNDTMATDTETPPIDLRRAESDDLVDVMRILDGALLAIDEATVRDRIVDGTVGVAEVTTMSAETPVADREPQSEADTTSHVVGAIVIEPADDSASDGEPDRFHIDAVAVTRTRRGTGIGSALVEFAAELARERHADWLTADCDASLRPFYLELGFDVGGDGAGDRATRNLEQDDEESPFRDAASNRPFGIRNLQTDDEP